MDIFEDIDMLVDNDIIDLIDIVNRERKKYTIRPRTDKMNIWDDKEFIRRFMISKASVRTILQLIEDELTHRTNRNNPIPPLQQLLLMLRFLSFGSFYIAIAYFGGIHKSTCGKIIQRVVHALAGLRSKYINFPDSPEKKHASILQFSRIARFPRVLGAIDCTRIKLQSPGKNIAENFRKRKGYFSLNVQAVCNANMHVIDIVVRWPAHDSYIFNNSVIMMRFETGEMENALLLGDSGYPLRSYLLTPLDNPLTEGESLYNEAHIRTRNIIERTFGIWKRRFPILSIGIRSSLPLAQAIIVATAVLHNVARQSNDELPVVQNVDDHEIPLNNRAAEQAQERGTAARQAMIDYFANLL